MHDPAAFRLDSELVARYDGFGPRYTSYPTAVQFREDFGAEAYAHEARRSNDDPIPRALSVYVHIPFCASPCFYCACTRVVTRDPVKAELYLCRLERELELQGALYDCDRVVSQLHFGGGTPTFLGASQLAELMAMLERRFTLCETEDREFSIEIDPRTVSEETVERLAGMGFNRVSLGVQDFDPLVQRAVNRVQGLDDTLTVMQAARRVGFRSVSVDLIYGLPLQTPESFSRTLDTVIAARPDRIATYGYAHLPRSFKPQRRILGSQLPAPALRLALLGLTVERLTRAGYVYIGMDHFARPEDELARALADGSLHRNFQGYSTHGGSDLIGLGMSAIGAVGDCYVQNHKTLDRYYGALDAGRLPVWRGLRLSCDDKLRRDVIQGLMCRGRVDYAALERRYELSFRRYFAAELEALAPMAEDGLVEIGPACLRVTPVGRFLVRSLAMVFDAYVARNARAGEPRFSRVI
jgi:oxygen-independent coproporphyrinogen-3 oxidase